MFERRATADAVASFVLPFFAKRWYTKTGMLSAVGGTCAVDDGNRKQTVMRVFRGYLNANAKA